MHSIQVLKDYIFTIKLPFRIIALISIVFIGGTSVAFTYKAGIDVWNFFSLSSQVEVNKNILCFIMGWLVGIATVIQSAPVIWDRLSYWGQCIDNAIIKFILKKKYFLDDSELLLSETRKLINKVNNDFHTINWKILTERIKTSNPKLIKKLDELISNEISQANVNYSKIIKLLKENEAADRINMKRKNDQSFSLNTIIIQITDICNKIKFLKSTLNS